MAKRKEAENGNRQYRLKSLMNVRARPSTDAERLDVLKKGTVVEVSGIEGEWFSLANGGYILYADGKYAAEV